MDIISRLDAARTGQKTFFTGKPCRKAGHASPRYTSTGNCIECLKIYSAAFKGTAVAGAILYPAQTIHIDDADKISSLIDYLNAARGLAPAQRPNGAAVLPTAWEVHLAKYMAKPRSVRPGLADIRHIARALGIPEAYTVTEGPPVDDWSRTSAEWAAERERRIQNVRHELDADGYGPGEKPPEY